MLEVHADPDNALSDGYQTITPIEMSRIHRRGMALLEALHGFDEADDLVPDVAALTHLGTIESDIGAGFERIA